MEWLARITGASRSTSEASPTPEWLRAFVGVRERSLIVGVRRGSWIVRVGHAHQCPRGSTRVRYCHFESHCAAAEQQRLSERGLCSVRSAKAPV